MFIENIIPFPKSIWSNKIHSILAAIRVSFWNKISQVNRKMKTMNFLKSWPRFEACCETYQKYIVHIIQISVVLLLRKEEY
jgi:hypothetical protein